MRSTNTTKWIWLSILACAALYILNTILSTGIYDVSDGLAHYAIARYAPKHPELYLDHWGKPLFTTLASGFTYFGIKGVITLNILLFVLTARLLVSIVNMFKLPYALLVPLFLASVPVYYQTVMSGLTEILFATLATASLWAFAKQRFWLVALLVGFLPFARSEAYFVVPLFTAALLLHRQWLAVLLIAFAPLVMSFIGWGVFDDFWWIINNNPYTGARDIYGQGDLGHFVNNRNSIFGLGLSIFFVLGVFYLPRALSKWRQPLSQVYGLALAAAVLVIAAHSIFWWKGLYGSLGLFRVLATVAPYALVVGWIAFGALAKRFVHPSLPAVVLLIMVILNINSLLVFQPIAKKPSTYEVLAAELRSWYQQSPYANNPNVWFMHPLVGYFLNIDDREPKNSNELWDLNRIMPSNSIRENGLIIYDEAHAPNEGKTSKELLLADPHLRLVKSIAEETTTSALPARFLAFVKHTSIKGDTLVYEDFNTHRPLLEGRLDRIVHDSTSGDSYLKMLTWSAYMQVHKFWIADSLVWQAPQYNFWYKAEKELEVNLVYTYEDGRVELKRWRDGIFSLPPSQHDLVSFSLDLRNPNNQLPIRVYEWGLIKVGDE